MVDATNYVPVGPALASYGPEFSILDVEAGFGEYLSAQTANVLRDSPTSSVYRSIELGRAGRYAFDPIPEDLPADSYLRKTLEENQRRFTRVSNEHAKAQIADAGLKLDIGDGPISQEALDILIRRGRERMEREVTVSGYSPSALTQLTTSVGASLLDPLNIAAGFVPFVGQTRAMNMLARAGSFGGRTMARAKIGAIEGLGGAALVEPLIAAAATQEGRDYTAFHSLQNLLFGAGFGSGLHMAFGGAAEKITGRTYRRSPAETPGDLVDRLPYEAKEAAMRAAVADVLAGREVSASDVLDYLAKQDPDLADQLRYVATLRRDGPEIDDTLARVEYWKGKLSGKRRKPEQTSVEDFMSWVRSHGGVRDTDGVLEAALDEALPRTAMIKRKGLKRTDRGVEFDELFKRAVEAGFVRTKDEFVDAFKAGQKSSPLRPVLREIDERQRLEAAEILREEQEYIAAAQEAAGVDPNARPETRARAIVGREQHVVAAERARLNTAIDRLIARREAIARGEAPPPPPKEEQSAQTRAEIEAGQVKEGEEVPEAGDTVSILDETGAPMAVSEAGPDVVVKSTFTDPNYGTYVFFDDSAGLGSGGIPIGRVKVTRKAQKPQAGELAKGVEKDRAKQAKETVAKKQARQETGKVPERKQPEWKSAPSLAAEKLKRIRQDLDEMFPNMATKGEYYLSALTDMHFIGRYEFNFEAMRKALNNMISKKELVARNADTGDKLPTIDSTYFDINTRLDQPDVLLTFKNKVKARKAKGETPASKTKQPSAAKLGPLSPEENAAVAAEYAKIGSARKLRAVAEDYVGDNKRRHVIYEGDKPIAVVTGGPRKSAREVFDIDSIDAYNDQGKLYNLDEARGKLGPSILRKIGQTMQELYPNITRVAGERVTGARSEREWITRSIPLPRTKEQNAAVAAEYAKIGSANRKVETPPAEKEALTSPELNDVTARYQQIEADTTARLERILPLLPEDTAANIRAQLAKVDREADDLLDVYETAVKCLLKPPV
jgi:hypothetical protein